MDKLIGGEKVMKLLCTAAGIAGFFIVHAIDVSLSPGQAVVMAIPTAVIFLWSFMQTDWYEPGEKESALAERQL